MAKQKDIKNRREFHISLRYDNVREGKVIALVEDAMKDGISQKEYFCRLVEESGMLEKLILIEQLLKGMKVVSPDTTEHAKTSLDNLTEIEDRAKHQTEDEADDDPLDDIEDEADDDDPLDDALDMFHSYK